MTYPEFLTELAKYRGLFHIRDSGAIRISDINAKGFRELGLKACLCPGLVVLQGLLPDYQERMLLSSSHMYDQVRIPSGEEWRIAVMNASDNYGSDSNLMLNREEQRVRVDLLRVLELEE